MRRLLGFWKDLAQFRDEEFPDLDGVVVERILRSGIEMVSRTDYRLLNRVLRAREVAPKLRTVQAAIKPDVLPMRKRGAA